MNTPPENPFSSPASTPPLEQRPTQEPSKGSNYARLGTLVLVTLFIGIAVCIALLAISGKL